ncbi:sensor histidine kinase [Chitinibacter sp. S2-10]|uniref:sensor histidine kinase n=1 Tax=Chitinibacter sp. S2-10 TaxID=3373597 RepID=UPI0039777E9F
MNMNDHVTHRQIHNMTESDAAFRLLVTCVQDYAIYILDLSGHIISWNIGAERIHGYNSDEVIGQHFSIFFPGQANAHERSMQELEQARTMGRFENDDLRRRKDGSLFLAQVVVTPLLDEAGVIQGFAKVTRDVSTRKRLEESFQQVVQEAPNAMIMVNLEGIIVLANRHTETTFGYLQHELMGQSIEMLVPERFRHGHAALRNGFFTTPIARPMGAGRDLYGLHKDGSEFPVEIGLNPIDTEHGKMVLAAIVDITSRKQAQQQIEAALAEKTVLLNEIHHRVKNNLQVIISLLNMQANLVLDQAMKDVLIDSQTRVRSMALIHQLLYERHDFSRVDLGEYLQRFGQLLLSSLGALVQRIQLNIETEEQPVLIELQRATPCGLLINELVINAFKHAYPDPSETGKVTIKLQRLDATRAVLTVADHGVGLPVNDSQLHTKSLGLQLIPILADQIGGELSIHDNQPGVRFELHLPIMEETHS